MNQRGEASVEEILDSIKKVIARDNRETSSATRQQRASAGVPELSDEGEDDGILDLADTEMMADDDYLTDPDHAESSRDEQDDGRSRSGTEEGEHLTTAAVRGSMEEHFAALAMLAEPGARPQIVRSGETSLEGMVREMLRPMLAEWLDKNLPTMVERLVKAEIARIARKRS